MTPVTMNRESLVGQTAPSCLWKCSGAPLGPPARSRCVQVWQLCWWGWRTRDRTGKRIYPHMHRLVLSAPSSLQPHSPPHPAASCPLLTTHPAAVGRGSRERTSLENKISMSPPRLRQTMHATKFGNSGADVMTQQINKNPPRETFIVVTF